MPSLFYLIFFKNGYCIYIITISALPTLTPPVSPTLPFKSMTSSPSHFLLCLLHMCTDMYI